MAEVAVLERVLVRLAGQSTSKDRLAVREGLNELKKGVLTMPLADSVPRLWKLVFLSGCGIGANELNALEKMLSYGLITSSSTTIDAAADTSPEPIYILSESIRMAAGLTMHADTQLETIKLFLTACTTTGCHISQRDLFISLDALAGIVATSRIPINKSAAKGAYIQIFNESLARSHEATVGWLCRRRDDAAELSVMSLELLCGFLEKHLLGSMAMLGDICAFILSCCDITEKAVFDGVVKVLWVLMREEHLPVTKEAVELVMHRLFFPHTHLTGADRTLPMQVHANRMAFIDLAATVGPQLLMDLFLNIDADRHLESVVGYAFGLLSALVQRQDPFTAAKSPAIGSVDGGASPKALGAILGQLRALIEWAWEDDTSTPITDLDRLEAVHVQKVKQREAVGLFNKRPKLGMELAMSHDLVGSGLAAQVRFLRFTPGLSKTVIGDFVSLPENEELLKQLVACLSFEGKPIVGALAEFLQLFRLPGEAQKIDRIVEAFADQYCATSRNEALDKIPDLVFQLAFTIVMLNTDLHSPQIKDKMSFEAFVTNCRGLEQGASIPEAVLREIYTDVETSELQLADQVVLSPLPLGSRGTEPFRRALDRRLVLLVLRESSRALSGALLYAMSHTEAFESTSSVVVVPEGVPATWYGDCLEVVQDIVDLFVYHGLEQDAEPFLMAVLESPSIGRSLPWLYGLVENHGKHFAALWTPVTGALARFDLGAAVDEHHNWREVELDRLEGRALLYFVQSLLTVPPGGAHYEAFMRHYARKLEALPSLCLERLTTWSYAAEAAGTLGIFGVLTRTFYSPHLRAASFALVNRICQEQMPQFINGREKALSEFYQALIQLGLDWDPQIAEDAIGMFRFTADLLYTAQVRAGGGHVDREEFLLRWNPIISGLAHVAIHQDNVVICGNAIKMVFEIIRQQGVVYTPEHWRKVFRGVFMATIEDLSMQRGKLANDLIITALNWIIEIVTEYGSALIGDPAIDALGHVLGWIEDMVARPSDQLARSSLVALNSLIAKNHGIFREHHWDLVMQALGNIVAHTLPTELLAYTGDEADEAASTRRASVATSPRSIASVSQLQAFSSASLSLNAAHPDFQVIRYKCALQLLIMHSMQDLILNSGVLQSQHLSLDHLDLLLSVLGRSASFARDFNQSVDVRRALHRANFLDSMENILLSKQEAAAAQLSMHILFRAFAMERFRRDAARFDDVLVQRLRYTSMAVLENYIALLEDSAAVSTYKRSAKSWLPVVRTLFQELGALASERWIGEFFQPALAVYRLGSTEVSDAAHAFLTSLCLHYIK